MAERARHHRGAVLLLVVLAFVVLVPWLATPGTFEVDLGRSRLSPRPAHPFGTDASGRDLFVRVAQALGTSLWIAALCAVLSAVIGTLVGAVAALLGGWADELFMRLADVTNALPHLLLGIVVVAFFPGAVWAIVASVALTHWPQVARLVRSVTLDLRRAEYLQAAVLAGARRRTLLRRHLLPAVTGQVLVAVALMMPHAIWHESTLSFLGLGLPADRPSLGTLLATSRGEVLLGTWWALAFPALAIVVATVAVSQAAHALRRSS